MPRLKLLASCIAARLSTTVIEALDFKDVLKYFWSDSTTALAWIRRNDEWGRFVGNRVKEICVYSTSDQWRYVPTSLNLADLPSRGCTSGELLKSRWWEEGVNWLKKPEEEWLKAEEKVDEDEIFKEKKKETRVVLIVANDYSSQLWYAKSSSFRLNVRKMVHIFRLKNWIKMKEKIVGEKSVKKIMNAEKAIFKLVQAESFKPNENVISGIPVVRDEDGLIHVKTKLLNREDSELFRFPVLLPHSHPVVEQMIRELHIFHGHAGAQMLMSALREACWIIRGRQALKSVINKCQRCLRYSSKTTKVIPAPLPNYRGKDAKAFEVIGVDLCGPLHLKDGSKTWIVLFTCAIYRCIHLELVTSLSTETFLLALQRFVKRRGRPSVIYSDNGLNFVGANNLFKSLDWKRIREESRLERISWKFNPPQLHGGADSGRDSSET